MPENAVAGYQGPDYEEVQQFEAPPELRTVPVELVEPANVRQLPAVDAQIMTRVLNANSAIKLVSPNEFRGMITVVSDDVFYLARTKGEAEAEVGLIPGATVIELRAPVEYWAMGAVGAVNVTLILEEWTQ